MSADNDPRYFDPARIPLTGRELSVDLAVYGATAAGVAAAVRARRMGKTVALLHPGSFVGGMTTGGLSYTDLGNKGAIGGLAREFYRRVGRRYGLAECWKFEPSAAAAVLRDLLDEHGVAVEKEAWLTGIDRSGRALRRLHFIGGLSVEARMFVDATYEGDLMAMAGVPWTMGREAAGVYGEGRNGQQIHPTHQFDVEVDPFVAEGRPGSGLLPFVERDVYREGAGDSRLQAYNFRVCMSEDPANRVPFERPDDYRSEWYELAARFWERTGADAFKKFDRLVVPTKTDTNNHGAVSTDFIGANQLWIAGTYPEREKIFRAHLSYQRGLHWFMANDPRVPAPIRAEYGRWGLAADEFPETGNWPHQLYVREARRMVGDYVITQNDCSGENGAKDPVGLAAYQMDSHHVRRLWDGKRLRNEGDVQAPLRRPYAIPFRSIVPPAGSVPNLVAPVCVSASHIAFGSVRMEPVFMILADSGAQAACLALDAGVALQDLPYRSLEASLRAAGQVLSCAEENTGDGNPGED
jgi:hypothetical protein